MQFMTDRKRDVTVRNEKKLFSVKTGERIGRERRLSAEFERGIPGWALPIALEFFPMAPEMKPDGMPLERWLCWYDSKFDQIRRGYSDEERELIEEYLSNKIGVIKVEAPKVKPPYPKYVQHRKVKGQRTIEHAIKDIVATFDAAGFDVELALAFERQNENNAEVIAALEGLLVEPEVEEELVAN